MKQIACKDLGGPATCDEVLKGETAEEIISNGWRHIEGAHPELAENIRNNPQDVNDRWMNDFKARFPSLPEAGVGV